MRCHTHTLSLRFSRSHIHICVDFLSILYHLFQSTWNSHSLKNGSEQPFPLTHSIPFSVWKIRKKTEEKNKYHPQISILVIKISNARDTFYVRICLQKEWNKRNRFMVNVEKVNLNVTVTHDFQYRCALNSFQYVYTYGRVRVWLCVKI